MPSLEALEALGVVWLAVGVIAWPPRPVRQV